MLGVYGRFGFGRLFFDFGQVENVKVGLVKGQLGVIEFRRNVVDWFNLISVELG